MRLKSTRYASHFTAHVWRLCGGGGGRSKVSMLVHRRKCIHMLCDYVPTNAYWFWLMLFWTHLFDRLDFELFAFDKNEFFKNYGNCNFINFIICSQRSTRVVCQRKTSIALCWTASGIFILSSIRYVELDVCQPHFECVSAIRISFRFRLFIIFVWTVNALTQIQFGFG